jgi:hypothetical protein
MNYALRLRRASGIIYLSCPGKFQILQDPLAASFCPLLRRVSSDSLAGASGGLLMLLPGDAYDSGGMLMQQMNRSGSPPVFLVP